MDDSSLIVIKCHFLGKYVISISQIQFFVYNVNVCKQKLKKPQKYEDNVLCMKYTAHNLKNKLNK